MILWIPVMFRLLLEAVLLGFDHSLAIYTFNFAMEISNSEGLVSRITDTEKSSFSTYLKYCGNMQADHHSHLSLSNF
jgi:hypothetical protein